MIFILIGGKRGLFQRSINSLNENIEFIDEKYENRMQVFHIFLITSQFFKLETTMLINNKLIKITTKLIARTNQNKTSTIWLKNIIDLNDFYSLIYLIDLNQGNRASTLIFTESGFRDKVKL